MRNNESPQEVKGALSNTTVDFYGPAYSVRKGDELLAWLQNRQDMTPEEKNRAMLMFQNHNSDPVGGLPIVGGNPGTGGTIPEASSGFVQAVRAATGRQTSDHQSSSSSIGISLSQDKAGVTVSANQASGDGNGQDTIYTNTHVAGQAVNIQSGGDTTLKGAVVTGNQVTATVGGNLNVESLQDSSRYKESSQNTGVSVTVFGKPGGSLSAGASNINSNYQSVVEQSGIRAGDGGFNVNVQGNTDLKGGAITSTQKAIDDTQNSFTTGGTLTTSDIQNRASYTAESYQVSVGSSGGSAGVGQDSGSAASTTRAAISGIAGNKDARTGDAESGIAKIFDQAAVSGEINAQVAITQEFGKQAPKAVADYAQAKAEQLKKEGKPEEAKKWEEGGIYRVALHTTLGALSGGTAGAVGAAGVASAAPQLDKLQDGMKQSLKNAGMSDATAEAVSKTITQGAVVGAGAAVGGVQTGAMALNIDANNRIQHISRKLSGVAKLAPGEHRASVVERDKAEQFPADIRKALGEPILLPNGKYGYVLEDLKSADGKLYPVTNGLPNLTGDEKSAAASLNSLRDGSATIYRIDPDNFGNEDNLLRDYAKSLKSGMYPTYPSGTATMKCYLDMCENFTNSNTMADTRLQRSGINPPNTGTTNVPGGLHDSEKNPLDALKKSYQEKKDAALKVVPGWLRKPGD